MADESSGWTDITDHTSANIQALRRQAGLSRKGVLERLEKMAGVQMHETTLRRIEEGSQQAKALEAAAFARVFRINVGDLISKPIDPKLAELYGYIDACKKDMDEFNISSGMLVGTASEAWRYLEEFDPDGASAYEPSRELRNLLLGARGLVKSVVELRRDNGLEDALDGHGYALKVAGWWEHGEG